METTPRSASHVPDPALERLRRDLMQVPPDTELTDLAGHSGHILGEGSEPRPIDYAAMEFEVDRLRQRLAIWEIFMAYVRDGARTWTDVQRAMTPDDLERIIAICDGAPLRDVLLHLR